MADNATAAALTKEIQRHEQTKRLLAKNETAVKRLTNELHELQSDIGGFRADRNYLQEKVAELKETNKELMSAIERQKAQVAEMEKEKALLDDIKKRLAEAVARLASQKEELDALRKEKQEFNEKLAQSDKKLSRANMEKKRFKKTSSQAGNHLQDAVAVVGETVLNLNAEVERIMVALKDLGMADGPPPDMRRKVEV